MNIKNNCICIKNNVLTNQRGVETSFCVRDIGFEYHYTTVEHFLLAKDKRVCKKCLRFIIRNLKK